jgi:hypothetical protein
VDSDACRAFTALHALRRLLAPLQGVFFPAMVTFERPASDTPVAQLPIVNDCSLMRALAIARQRDSQRSLAGSIVDDCSLTIQES